MAEKDQESEVLAKDRYKELEENRKGPLSRARKNAKLTVPHVYPPEGADEQTELYDPFQTIGNQGVNNLAAKMTLAVMPPNTPFFRHDPDTFAMEEMEEMQPGAKRDAIRQLARYDRAAMRKIEQTGDRPKIEQVMRHLLIGGNVLLDLRETTARVINLANYVVVRDNRGKVLELIVEENVYLKNLPDEVQNKLPESAKEDDTKPLTLYTHATFDGKKYALYQEIEGVRVPGSDGMYKPEDFPLIALRFFTIDGESYGRSFVEGVYGDLSTLEALSEATTDGASLAAFVLFLVNPNGTTKVTDVNNAKNGDFISGNEKDITTLQLDKFADFRWVDAKAERIEEGLKDVFLMRSSVARNAERVTAEEIRYVALEIEDALSGIYSTLTQEFQLPYVRLKMKAFKDLPKLPEEVVGITITTGLEALRRSQELQKLDQWVERMQTVYGPDRIMTMLNPETYGDLVAASLGIDLEGLVNDEGEQVQSTLNNAATNAAPDLIKGAIANGNIQGNQGG